MIAIKTLELTTEFTKNYWKESDYKHERDRHSKLYSIIEMSGVSVEVCKCVCQNGSEFMSMLLGSYQ
jgi:hypothetical protein